MADEQDAGPDVGLASVPGRWETRRGRAAKGLIHISGSDQRWELNRQGRCRFPAGRGVTDVDGERFRWEAGDALAVPVREAGVTIGHHNPHDEPARFVCAWPNLPAVLGVDMGAGLEQVEAAPELPG